jgi:Family of unknown function (DUF6350)
MTDLASRPLLRVEPGPPAPERPSPLPSVVAALAAAAAGLVVCLACAVAGWFSAGTGSFSAAVRAGALAWLMSNGSGLHTPAVAITAVPLGALLVVVWLVYRGGCWAGARSPSASLRDVARSTGVLAAVYGLAAVGVALVGRGSAVDAGLARTALASVVIGLAAGGAGILRGSGLSPRLVAGIPAEARAALRGAAAGLATMLGAGALLLAGSLVAHFSTAVNIAVGMRAGVVGGALVVLAGVCLAPNAVVYAGAFAAGPGFALGTGTAVAPGGVRLGPLPAFPLLAAVPRDVSAAWLQALVAVPVLAGVLAGLVVARRAPTAGSLRSGLLGGLAGVLGAVGFAVLCQLASGAVGPGRMHDVGPRVAATLVVCAAAGLLGGSVTATGASWVGGARTRRLAARPPDRSPGSAEESAPPAEESRTSAEESATPAEESRTSAEESATPAEESATPADEATTPAEESGTPPRGVRRFRGSGSARSPRGRRGSGPMKPRAPGD